MKIIFMRIHLAKSINYGEGYVSTLSDDGDSLACQPFSCNDESYRETVSGYQSNSKLQVVPIDSKIGFEQSYFITEAAQ